MTPFHPSSDIYLAAWAIPHPLPIPPPFRWRSLEIFVSVSLLTLSKKFLVNEWGVFVFPNDKWKWNLKLSLLVTLKETDTASNRTPSPAFCLAYLGDEGTRMDPASPLPPTKGVSGSLAQWGKLRDNPASLCLSSSPRGQDGASAKSFIWFKHSFC